MLSSNLSRLLSALPLRTPPSQLLRSRRLSSLSEAEKLAQIRAGIAPATGRSLDQVAREVWGHVKDPVGPGHRSGQKILRRPLKGPLYTSWYPPPLESMKGNPITLTEKQERWQKKLKILRAAGKGPPKKGAGKRSK